MHPHPPGDRENRASWRLLGALALAVSALPGQGVAQEASAVVEIATGWRSIRAPLVAKLGGTSVDDSSWDEVRLTAPWSEQLVPGYD